LKQGDLIKVFVEDFGSNGEGVGKVGDNYVYTSFALPKEIISARVLYAKRNTVFASPKEIIKASPQRVDAKCAKFGKCGGCQLQHANYQAQLEFKRKCVKQNLSKIGGIDIAVEETVASEMQWGYRNKVQFPVGEKNGKPVVGFFKNDTHTLVQIEECPLQDQWAKKMTDAFLEYATKAKVKPYNERNHSGILRHLVGRYLDGQLLVTVVVNADELPAKEVLVAELKKRFNDFGLFVNVNKAKTNVILGKQTRWIFGRKVITSKVEGIEFFLRPDSFFQINFDIMKKIYAKVKEFINATKVDVLVDCFSGSGVLSAGLYQSNVVEYAIEIVESSTADAEQLKEKNNLTNLTNICGDVAKEHPQIMQRHSGQKTAVVLDPPRKGVDKGTIDLLLQTKPSVIVYVSCDSATLARDLKLLTQTNEYQIKLVQPYDMFPQTKHVETLVVLSR